MADLLFLNGRIRALESKLLNFNRLERMIGAPSAPEAFRVLSELQYAEYFDQSLQPSEFERVIDQGLQETKELIMTGTDNAVQLQFFWLRFDTNNLKRALKLRLLEDADSLGDFSVEAGFAPLGNYPQEVIEALAWETPLPDGAVVYPEIQAAVTAAVADYAENADFQRVEFALDQAYFETLRSILKQTNTAFARTILRMQADRENIMTVARCLAFDLPLTDAALLPYGNVKVAELQAVEAVQEIAQMLDDTWMEPLYATFQTATGHGLLQQLEKRFDQLYFDFLIRSEEGEIETLQIPMVYYERRLRNAKMLKFIMFAKLNGIDTAAITDTLQTF